MLELIEIITCRITIIKNWLPVYQLVLLVYLSLPVIIITYYQKNNPQNKRIILAIILLIIWIIQLALWNKGYNYYYQY